MSEQRRRVLYQYGLVRVSELTDEDVAELRKWRCGVHQTADRIRTVVVEPDNTVRFLDQKANGIEESKIRVVNRGHLDYLHGKDTKRARQYEKEYCGAE